MTEDSAAANLDPSAPQQWRRLPAIAGKLALLSGALVGAAIGIGLAIAAIGVLSERLGFSIAAAAAMVLALLVIGLIWGGWLGYVRWKFSAWKLDAVGLRVKRGRFWRTEILIPRARVQHLDLQRGPLERRFGLATLIVHTAGTRVHALRQSGLLETEALALRDALVPTTDRRDDVV
jgi:membrane protein YdbS with pleckstrin-like domain